MGLFYFEKALIIKRVNPVQKWSRNDLNVTRITRDNINHSQDFNDPSYLKKAEEFMVTGNYGYYCFRDELCALRMWIFTQTKYARVGDVFVYDLRKDETWVAYGLTAPESRGIGVFPYTLNYIIHDLGQKEIYGYIAPTNKASIRGVTKAGFKIINQLYLLRIWRIKFQFYFGQNEGLLKFRFKYGNLVR